MPESQQPELTTPIEALRERFTGMITQATTNADIRGVMCDIFDIAQSAISGDEDTPRQDQSPSQLGIPRHKDELSEFTDSVGRMAITFAILGVETDSLPKLDTKFQ